MTHERALELYAAMPPREQASVMAVFLGIIAAFPSVREAFVQAVYDEVLVIETEMTLLEQTQGTIQ